MNPRLDLACRLDPAVLARRVWGAQPDPWQERLLRSAAPRISVNVTRQGGKTSVASVKALHAARYRPPTLVLCLSPSLRQSGILFRRIVRAYRKLGEKEPPEAESALRLELKNGSEIVSLPGNEATVRGYSGVGLLLVDEAARVPNDLYHAITPMLAVSGGQLITMSTPYGQQGWWHDEWIEGEGWEKYEVPANICPRISPAFLERERRSMGDVWWRQEYFCQFAPNSFGVFNPELVRAALDPSITPLFERMEVAAGD